MSRAEDLRRGKKRDDKPKKQKRPKFESVPWTSYERSRVRFSPGRESKAQKSISNPFSPRCTAATTTASLTTPGTILLTRRV